MRLENEFQSAMVNEDFRKSSLETIVPMAWGVGGASSTKKKSCKTKKIIVLNPFTSPNTPNIICYGDHEFDILENAR